MTESKDGLCPNCKSSSSFQDGISSFIIYQTCKSCSAEYYEDVNKMFMRYEYQMDKSRIAKEDR